jgi:2-dehydro-3-deoxyphosphogluconate aldolase / (4S)-4-hydroxy-2-oxoglutarate aldolase
MKNWLTQLQAERLIAVIRSDQKDISQQMSLAIAKGGIRLIEVTWNSDGVQHLIPQLQEQLPECQIGTGTVLNLQMAREAIACGTRFIFTPNVDAQIIALCQSFDLPIICGALTPTEILAAWNYGATAVKVFPIKCLGGAKYLECLRPVFPHIPLIPTGGVTQANAIEMLNAGAIALGVSTALTANLTPQSNWQQLSDRAKLLVETVKKTENSDFSV